MIHLVHFWLKEEYKTAEKRAEFEQALEKLCQVSLSSKSNWGVPADVPVRPVVDVSWDYNLVTYFDSVEVHNEYQVHPEHQAFLEYKDWWEKVLVIDSELKD